MPYFPRGESVTVHDSTVTTDRYGNDTFTWTVGAMYERCVVSARRSGEGGDLTDQGRQGVVVGLKVMLPSEAVVSNHSRLEVRGDLYEIVGEPFAPHSPFTGLEPGVSVDLRRVEG